MNSSKEELEKLEGYIKNELFNGRSYSDLGVDIAKKYINLVEDIEGKKEKSFNTEIINKYVHLMSLSEVRNNAFWNEHC